MTGFALVTGAAGFIGSHVAEALLDRGWRVRGIDTLLTGRMSNVPDGVVFSDWDVRDGSWWQDEYDLIVHCAASYDDPSRWRRDIEVNAVGCANVARVAEQAGARVFYFQTSLPPISSYAISKIAGQQYLEMSGADVLTFRLANMYGPRNVSGPVPAFFKRLVAGETPTVVETQRDMVFILDLVDGVMRAVDRPGVSGVVDMCSGRDYWIADVYDAVAAVMGVDTVPRLVRPAADDVPKMLLDGTRARLELGWVPSVGLADGVAAAVEWYERFGVDRTFTHLRIREAA